MDKEKSNMANNEMKCGFGLVYINDSSQRGIKLARLEIESYYLDCIICQQE